MEVEMRQETPRQKETSVWKNKNFVVLFLTSILVGFGGRIYELALPLIIFEIYQSPVVMGTMRAIELLPNLFLAMFIGVFVDRINQKKLIQLSLIIQAIFLSVLFYLLINNNVNTLVFYTFAFILMTFSYTFENAKISITKKVIHHSLLTSANAKFASISTIIMVLGPALSGLLLIFSDLRIGLLITAIAMFISSILVTFLKFKPEKKMINTTFKQDFIEGIKELKRNKPLLQITLLVIFINSTAGIFGIMFIYYTKEVLSYNSAQIGIVFSVLGFGGLVGSLLVNKVRNFLNIGPLLGYTFILIGITYLLLFLSDSFYLICLIIFINGILNTIQAVCVWTFRQETTPENLIGRISGLTGSLFKLGAPFAIFGASWIPTISSVSNIFLSIGLINLALFFVYRRLQLWSLN
ncbi:MFS transporter [Bacillus cereus]|nr:MFS transporter [Bacillus cereus]